ncbi:hypothetical protein VU09_31035 [Burkholderia pseudomallei]|nr:gp79 domain protein [Burkholderia pseudomallei MSHR4378]KKI72067.1 hypothetical protein VU09_31035 [Burkholderia pseudomallei]
MSLVSSVYVMQSHERDDRHSRPHPVRTTAKHQNSHISSGRGNEKAREAFTLRALVERPVLISGMDSCRFQGLVGP